MVQVQTARANQRRRHGRSIVGALSLVLLLQSSFAGSQVGAQAATSPTPELCGSLCVTTNDGLTIEVLQTPFRQSAGSIFCQSCIRIDLYFGFRYAGQGEREVTDDLPQGAAGFNDQWQLIDTSSRRVYSMYAEGALTNQCYGIEGSIINSVFPVDTTCFDSTLQSGACYVVPSAVPWYILESNLLADLKLRYTDSSGTSYEIDLGRLQGPAATPTSSPDGFCSSSNSGSSAPPSPQPTSTPPQPNPTTSNQPTTTSLQQPTEPCTRMAIENTADSGLTLFGASGTEKSFLEKSMKSDGLFDVTAHTDVGFGGESVTGVKVQFLDSLSVYGYIDTALHVDFGSTERTFWSSDGEANREAGVASNWKQGNVPPDQLATWDQNRDEVVSMIGVDVSGYSGFGQEVDGKGIDVNSGDSGVVWYTNIVNPHTGETSNSGVVQLTSYVGSGGFLSGVVSGNVGITVTYTEDSQKRPEKMTMDLETGASASVSIEGNGQDFFNGGLALGGGAIGAGIGAEVDTSVKLPLGSSANLDVMRNYSQSFTDPVAFQAASDSVVSQAEMTVAVYNDAGLSGEIGGKIGLGGPFSFSINWGQSTISKWLQSAAYSEGGGPLQPWTECMNGTTPQVSENA